MEYADGGDLYQRIKSQKGKRFTDNQILDWFTQICLAVKHIHDRKIIHRDIKSQNIFLTKNNLVKLGDFGISKCLNKTMDKAKTIIGTPFYFSPELINSQSYDFKSDIWSLGVLLYEMCSQKMPFDAPNIPQLSLKIINGKYTPLPSGFSFEIKALIHSMLNVLPSKRPTINEILNNECIKNRVKNFLTIEEIKKEFSHTVLHKFSFIKNEKNYGSETNAESNYNSNPSSLSSSRQGKEKKKETKMNNNDNLKEKKRIYNNIAKFGGGKYNQDEIMFLRNNLIYDPKEERRYVFGIQPPPVRQNQEKIVKIEQSKKKKMEKKPTAPLPERKLKDFDGMQQGKLQQRMEQEQKNLKSFMNQMRKKLKKEPSQDVIWMGGMENFVNNLSSREQEIKQPVIETQQTENNLDDKMTKDIKEEFGAEIVSDFVITLRHLVNDNISTFNFDELSSKIYNEYSNKEVSLSVVEKIIQKIPDIYYLILKEKL